MGTDQSSIVDQGKLSLIKLDEWELVNPFDVRVSNVVPYEDNDGNKINIFRNNRETIQKHTVTLKTEEDVKKYIKHLRWRQRCQQLVQAKAFEIKSLKIFLSCCQTVKEASLFTEFIPYRLADLPKIPFPFNLYILKEITEAFAYINKIYPLIKLDLNLICINAELKVKVWINSNLASHDPQICYETYSISNESKLLHQLLKLIEKKTEKQFNIMSFRQFLGKKQTLNVNYVKEGIEQYAQKLKVIFPTYLSYLTRDYGTRRKLIESKSTYESSQQDLGVSNKSSLYQNNRCKDCININKFSQNSPRQLITAQVDRRSRHHIEDDYNGQQMRESDNTVSYIQQSQSSKKNNRK